MASLALNFSKDLFNILRALYPEYHLSVTGVFCHQRPCVDIGESKCPEIGDLLLVFRGRNFHSSDRLNSLLLQAKMSNKNTLSVPSSEQHQLKLYKEWPLFKYRSGRLFGQTRDILPKTITDGAQYLLIDDNPVNNGLCGFPGTFPMGCAVADDTLILNNSLSDELFDFFKFKSGRAFEHQCSTPLKNDWSNMIWDLLSISKAVASKRKNAGLKKFSWMNEYVFCCTDNLNFGSIYSDLHSSEDYIERNCGEGEGVSVILIESSRMEQYS